MLRLLLLLSGALVGSARAEAIDCRVHNSLYLCLTAGSLLRVAFDDADAVQTIDDVELRLEGLKIDWISELAFADVSNASALYLRQNRLARVAKHFFRHLELLTYLDLKDNLVAQIEEGAFARLSNLETLLLDGNRLVTFQPGLWRGLGGLHELYATNNNVSLKRAMFRGLRQLETLALDANNITDVPVGTFEGLRHLDLLYLARNGISNLEPDVFQSLGELSELDLSGNRIASLAGETFRYLNGLEKLWLSANELTNVRATDFTGIGGLIKLYLNGNDLVSVDMTAFDVFKNVSIEPGFKLDGALLKSSEGVSDQLRCMKKEYSEPYECQRIKEKPN